MYGQQVRQFLLELQRDLARRHNVIMDGRDIGTVVLPDAGVKIFLTAAPEARARRRLLETGARGKKRILAPFCMISRSGIFRIEHRPVAPLKRAEDAALLDTTNLNLEQSL